MPIYGRIVEKGVACAIESGQSRSTCFYLFIYLFILFVVNFVIHWNKTAMGLHVFPIPIPPPTSLSTRSP